MDAFRYATLRHLLQADDLRLISVWNPTFLTLLLDALAANWGPLLDDLAAGTLTLPGEVAPEVALLGKDGNSGGARFDVDAGQSGGVEVGAQETPRGRGALDLRDEPWRTLTKSGGQGAPRR